MVTVKPGLSLAEFLKLSEEKPALEYEEGLVSQKVPPKGHHSTLQLTLASVINAWGQAREARLRLSRATRNLRWALLRAGRVDLPLGSDPA